MNLRKSLSISSCALFMLVSQLVSLHSSMKGASLGDDDDSKDDESSVSLRPKAMGGGLAYFDPKIVSKEECADATAMEDKINDLPKDYHLLDLIFRTQLEIGGKKYRLQNEEGIITMEELKTVKTIKKQILESKNEQYFTLHKFDYFLYLKEQLTVFFGYGLDDAAKGRQQRRKYRRLRSKMHARIDTIEEAAVTNSNLMDMKYYKFKQFSFGNVVSMPEFTNHLIAVSQEKGNKPIYLKALTEKEIGHLYTELDINMRRLVPLALGLLAIRYMYLRLSRKSQEGFLEEDISDFDDIKI